MIQVPRSLDVTKPVIDLTRPKNGKTPEQQAYYDKLLGKRGKTLNKRRTIPKP